MFEVLSAEIDKLRDLDVEALDDVSVHQAVIDLQREIDRLAGFQCRVLRSWDNRGMWSSDGSKSPRSRLSRETGLSSSDSGHLIWRARRLDSMPLTSCAFENSLLSSSRVDLLARANRPEVREIFVRDEATLIENVSTLRFSDASRLVSYWSACADEEGSETRAEQLVAQRSASVAKTFEGSVDLRAIFDPVRGEIFLNELERIEKELFEADWADAKRIYRDEVKLEDLGRSSSQRRCDALVEMAKRSGSVPEKASPPRPLITVVVGHSSLSHICELASGTVIAPGQVVPLLTDADIERIVFDGPSRVIDVGAKRRFFRGALRRAIEVRDRHCQHPSDCDEPAARCQTDHSVAFCRNGTTDQDNGQLLCAFHNRMKGFDPPATGPPRAGPP